MQILRYETYKQNVANTEKATQLMQQNLDEKVLEIIRAVQERGDEAALAYTKKFDKAAITSLSVSEEEWNNAFNSIKTGQPKLFKALTAAAENIRQYQKKQKKKAFNSARSQVFSWDKKLHRSIVSVSMYLEEKPAILQLY